MAVTDSQRLESSGRWAAITPDNDADLPGGVTRAIYVGGAGNLVADSEHGETSITFTGLAVGIIHPLRVRRVRESTTATGLVALY
ncbi:MAG: hypothetical protein KDE58_01435 [Caldilineaceae bacterium]|nr:hypothetical protein [Caldilineaceae bacterium]